MISRLQLARSSIIDHFDQTPERVYRPSDLRLILEQNRAKWKLAKSTETERFTNFLLENTPLRETTFASNKYNDFRRYVWRKATSYQLALSYRPGTYLSHCTAAILHQLIKGKYRTIYANCEQSPKPRSSALTQEGIDRAFSRKQRETNLIYENTGWRFVFLNGKHTGNLGVETIWCVAGEPLAATGLERTLIDIVVRPSYAAGVMTVLECYRHAVTRFNITLLLKILKKLQYSYPYHQAIGFYMQRAGYEKKDYLKLRNLGLRFDFYLAHGLEAKSYDRDWRLYYPRGM